MKLIIAGKNSIAVDVLEYAINYLDVEIFIVLNRTENFKNSFQKSLGFYANLWQIKILKLEEVYSFDDAVFLSLEFDRIININLFKTSQIFNIHFSLLPAYKGMYTSALPILHNKDITGVTLHQIDNGIDTGDIISQIEIEIEKIDTARTLYIKYIKKGTELVIKNIQDLIDNKFTVKKQSSIGSSYYGLNSIDYSNIIINYRQTAEQVINELRAFSYREYQTPKYADNEILMWKVLNNKSSLKPGEVVKENDYQVQVSTIDYDILLWKDFYDDLWKYCRENNTLSLLSLLKNQHVDLEKKTKEGWTALIIACYHNAYECVDILIKYGANVNAKNYNDTTTLMYAKSNYLRTNNIKILQLLIDNNAIIDAKDIYGKTILDWVKRENTELFKFLKEKI